MNRVRRYSYIAIMLLGSLVITFEAMAMPTVPAGYEIKIVSTGSFTLEQSNGIALDKENNIYINRNFGSGSNGGSSDILKIAPDGNVASVAFFKDQFQGGLVINDTGSLFGGFYSTSLYGPWPGGVFKYENGSANTVASISGTALEKLVFNKDDNLYVVGYNTKTIYEVSPGGSVTPFVATLGSDGPFGVTFKNNTLFVGDNFGWFTGIIWEVSPTGQLSNFFSPISGRINDLEYSSTLDAFLIANQNILMLKDNELQVFAYGFNGYIRDITLDKEGNMYTCDNMNLYKISAVPIPPTVWLLGSGLIGLAGLRRKFFRK